MGLLTAGWTVVHLIVATSLLPLYGLVLGFHALPGVIAQQVLRLPWVALITHGVAALVACAFVPTMAGRYLMVAVLFGGVQEGVSALTRYRHWEPWRFFLSAAATGVLLAVPMWLFLAAESLSGWAAILFVALFIVGPVAWTAVGLGVGTGLTRAGITRIRR